MDWDTMPREQIIEKFQDALGIVQREVAAEGWPETSLIQAGVYRLEVMFEKLADLQAETLDECHRPHAKVIGVEPPAEPEPKTVTLTSRMGTADWMRIDKLVPYVDGDFTLVLGRWRHDAETPWWESLEGILCPLSAAEITKKVRAVWPDFDCEGAVPRLGKTVTLHIDGDSYEYKEITEIVPPSEGAGPWVRGLWSRGGGVWNRTCDAVDESVAEITRLARAAWGDDWSCPGCDKPVVVLTPVYEKCTYRFSEITAIDPAEGDAYVTGERADDGVWVVKLRVDKTAADVRAACAAAGVPCPPEEKPVVALPYGGETPVLFSEVTHILTCAKAGASWSDRCKVWGTWQDFDGEWQTTTPADNRNGAAIIELPRPSIRAACAKARVPCCEEEEAEAEARLLAGGAYYESKSEKMEEERNALQSQLDARENWRETEKCCHCAGTGVLPPFTRRPNEIRLSCESCNGTGLVVKREKDEPEADSSADTPG